MADARLFWLATGLAVGVFALLTLAGFGFVGLFLAAVIWLAGRSATKRESRTEAEASLRRACDRLPFCDCMPE